MARRSLLPAGAMSVRVRRLTRSFPRPIWFICGQDRLGNLNQTSVATALTSAHTSMLKNAARTRSHSSCLFLLAVLKRMGNETSQRVNSRLDAVSGVLAEFWKRDGNGNSRNYLLQPSCKNRVFIASYETRERRKPELIGAAAVD